MYVVDLMLTSELTE